MGGSSLANPHIGGNFFTYSFFAMVIDTLCILSAKNFLPIGVLLVEIFPHFIKGKRQRGQNDNEYVGHL